MTPGQRAAVTRAINRFEWAVEHYSELGAIPVDEEAAFELREQITDEYHYSRQLLKALIERIAS